MRCNFLTGFIYHFYSNQSQPCKILDPFVIESHPGMKVQGRSDGCKNGQCPLSEYSINHYGQMPHGIPCKTF